MLNDFDVSVSNPNVFVFPVNGVGRPLGIASASSDVELAPGESWAFETNAITASGENAFAFVGGEPEL